MTPSTTVPVSVRPKCAPRHENDDADFVAHNPKICFTFTVYKCFRGIINKKQTGLCCSFNFEMSKKEQFAALSATFLIPSLERLET